QCLMNLPHVRYCGSVEHLDLGERDEPQSAALVDVGPQAVVGEPELLPLEATPFHDIVIADPKQDLTALPALYPDGDRALVRCAVYYRRSNDELQALLPELDQLFPRRL